MGTVLYSLFGWIRFLVISLVYGVTECQLPVPLTGWQTAEWGALYKALYLEDAFLNYPNNMYWFHFQSASWRKSSVTIDLGLTLTSLKTLPQVPDCKWLGVLSPLVWHLHGRPLDSWQLEDAFSLFHVKVTQELPRTVQTFVKLLSLMYSTKYIFFTCALHLGQASLYVNQHHKISTVAHIGHAFFFNSDFF
jgi:hypothetical protein